MHGCVYYSLETDGIAQIAHFYCAFVAIFPSEGSSWEEQRGLARVSLLLVRALLPGGR